MGWQDAPLVEAQGGGKAAWEMAPLVEEARPVQSDMYAYEPPPTQPTPQYINDEIPLSSALQQVKDQWTTPLPTRTPAEGKWWTENLPQSVAKIVPSTIVGTGDMIYNAAKKFTDPVVNAWTGKQDLGSAASDLFYAPRNVGQEFLNGLAQTTASPLGLGANEGDFKQAWSDPAAALAAVAPVGMAGFKGAKAMIPAATEASLTNELGRVVNKGFDKGIKPKGTPKTRTMLLEEQRLQNEAVKSIITGKEFLKFKDEFGDMQTGRVPKNLDELSQAIEQRKLTVITKANEMNKAAGAAGVEVPFDNIIAELYKVVDDTVLNMESPQMVNYAKKKIKDYEGLGSYTPEEAQKAMAIANQSKAIAEANMTPYNVSKAKVDALIANNLRKNLNTAVEGAEGPGYAELRKEYGALKSIEEPVNSRLKRHAQQNEKSALNFYDVFSASDLLQGALTGSPASAAKGIGLGYIGQGIKWAKDPNRQVRKMFERAEPIVGRLQNLMSEKEASVIAANIEPELQKLLPPPERGFTMRNPEDVYSPIGERTPVSPDISQGRYNQLALPPGKQNPLALPPGSPPPEMVPPEVSGFERLFQIAQSPQGMALLKERLGREAKYSKILEELQGINDKALLEYVPEPEPTSYPKQVQVWRIRESGPYFDQIQQYQIQPSGHVREVNPPDSLTKTKVYKIKNQNALGQ